LLAVESFSLVGQVNSPDGTPIRVVDEAEDADVKSYCLI
jgi:hypothetical protein